MRAMDVAEPPRLVPPTTAVRESWLAGERADRELDGESTELLEQATADFDRLVAVRQGTPLMWGVPTSVFWYVSGEHYLGELVIRHQLTPTLSESGGHIGYGISALWRGHGHGTRILAAGLVKCQRIGLADVLLTCDADNEASRRVIVANGGVPAGRSGGELRFWINVPSVVGEGVGSPADQ